MAEYPDVRIGTAERERAFEDLSHHFTAGRLSLAEFDERSAVLAAATTRAQVAAVFSDLPITVPQGAPPVKLERGSWDWRAGSIVLSPLLAVALFFGVDHSWVPFLLIPAVPAAVELGRRTLTPLRRRRQIEGR